MAAGGGLAVLRRRGAIARSCLLAERLPFGPPAFAVVAVVACLARSSARSCNPFCFCFLYSATNCYVTQYLREVSGRASRASK